MPVGINNLTVPVAPECVHRRHLGGTPGGYSLAVQRVHVLDVQVKGDGSPLVGLGRNPAGTALPIREFIHHHEYGIADVRLGVHYQLSIGHHVTAQLLDAEGLFVEVDGLSRILDNHVRGEGMESLWKRTYTG